MRFVKNYSFTVLEAAKKRMQNIICNNKCVLSFSGGKESLVLAHMAYTLLNSGKIPKENLEVLFIDEEAIFPCVEKIVRSWRDKFTAVGVKFIWVCSEFKHFSCFNLLYNDESFITFEESKKNVWVRKKEPNSVCFENPDLLSYQDWLAKYMKDRVRIIGMRSRESLHRRISIQNKHEKQTLMVYPIHDWNLNDVWLYLKENNIDIPEAYINMYKIGVSKNHLRISQFFSVDTAGSLVRMCEFYPDLYEKILKREPNAYLAMMYWDTEMFRRYTKTRSELEKEQKKDWFKEIEDLIASKKARPAEVKKYRNAMIHYGTMLLSLPKNEQQKIYKQYYGMIVAGDPKNRTCRAANYNIIETYSKQVGKNVQ